MERGPSIMWLIRPSPYLLPYPQQLTNSVPSGVFKWISHPWLLSTSLFLNFVMLKFDWLCDVCGCVMSPTLGIYKVDLSFINNYKESQLWLVLLRYSANVANTFSWIVTYGIRARFSKHIQYAHKNNPFIILQKYKDIFTHTSLNKFRLSHKFFIRWIIHVHIKHL